MCVNILISSQRAWELIRSGGRELESAVRAWRAQGGTGRDETSRRSAIVRVI